MLWIPDMKSDCVPKKGGENMAKKVDFLGKLKALEKDFENVQKMREEASRLAKKATEEEQKLSYRQYKALSLELVANDIDPSDLQFIVDACVYYKNLNKQGQPETADEEK